MRLIEALLRLCLGRSCWMPNLIEASRPWVCQWPSRHHSAGGCPRASADHVGVQEFIGVSHGGGSSGSWVLLELCSRHLPGLPSCRVVQIGIGRCCCGVVHLLMDCCCLAPTSGICVGILLIECGPLGLNGCCGSILWWHGSNWRSTLIRHCFLLFLIALTRLRLKHNDW